MNLLKLPLTFLLIIALLAIPVAGQHKRHIAPKHPAKTRAKASAQTPSEAPVKIPGKPAAVPAPTAAPTPTPEPVTFDTLLAADSYKIYGEIRGVGQLVRSSAVNDVLDPVLKLGGPGKDFVTIIDWLKAHADELTTSRMLIAAWPTVEGVPPGVIAIEFSSVQEATKFETQLNGVLAAIVPPVTPESSPPPEAPWEKQKLVTTAEKRKDPPAPVPGYYMHRADSLLLLSPQPIQLKKLKPAGSTLLSEDPNFRVAYNRFSSEPVFVYIDFKAIEKESEERRKQYEEYQKKAEAERKAQEEKEKAEAEAEGEAGDEMEAAEATAEASPSPEPSPEASPKEPTQAEALSSALSSLQYNLFLGAPDLPDALGIGFSPENESLNVRALMIDAAGATSDPVPFFAGLRFGAPVSPESPGVLPANSELVLTMSLNFDDIHARLSAMDQPEVTLLNAGSEPKPVRPPNMEAAPLATIERLLKIKIKDELLPLLGSEVAVALPLTGFGFFGPARLSSQTQLKADGTDAEPEPQTPVVVIALRDKEGMRQMMPKLLEGFAGKAATTLAQTERREDTEIVSFANTFAYAFAGNFLVLSADAAGTRRVVDAYLKGETLGSDVRFRNSTRWQPHLVQGQVYVSPALADSYKSWVNDASAHLGDEAREYMGRVTANSEPITYSLSNDGMGALHELHFPKSLAVMAVAGMANDANPPQTVKNERAAMGTLWSIANAQRMYKEKNHKAYASLDQLIAADLFSKDRLENTGYKFEINVTAEGYAVTAVPVEYGKTGKLSFFIDESGAIRGADHGGAPASASDKPIVGY